MTPTEFSDLLDRYGPELARWPSAFRVQAQQLLAQGPGAAMAAYRAAQEVERLLAAPVEIPSRALTDRILAASRESFPAKEERIDLWALFTGWQRALAGAAICASLLAGLFSGWLWTDGQVGVVSDEDIPGLTYSPGEDWGDWS